MAPNMAHEVGLRKTTVSKRGGKGGMGAGRGAAWEIDLPARLARRRDLEKGEMLWSNGRARAPVAYAVCFCFIVANGAKAPAAGKEQFRLV